MKIQRLLLKAFGPFTDTEIDFRGEGGTTSANLHVIYGANEAGKSSALRAMSDFRFGIPARSVDNFIHDNNKLRIAAEFETANGEALCLVRRKGNKNTLSAFDMGNGEAIDGSTVSREHELSLTDGLERAEYEAMFGLNHQRLRSGGNLLLKGQGELGSALFEASAGTRGMHDILSELEAEAKRYYSPRASSAVINAAKKSLDEQRRAWKQSLTRPADWQQLNRAHEQTKAALQAIDDELEALRRKNNELTELRTVAPLLQQYDRALLELQALADAPDLTETAREERQAAEQSLSHAQAAIEAANSEITRCAEALGELEIEPTLLEHKDAIERLAGKIDAVQQCELEVQQQHAAIASDEKRLLELATRIAQGKPIDEIIGAIPSEADLADLNHHLSAINRLAERQSALGESIEALHDAEASGISELPDSPDPVAREAVQSAMRNGQAMGDMARQIADMKREKANIEGKLAQALSDLAIAGDEQLRRARPLMDAALTDARHALAVIDDSIRQLQDEDQRLEHDLETQQQKQRQLGAEGEIVTFETLQAARQHRDQGWSLIRQVYVDKRSNTHDLETVFDPDTPLPDAFESAQANADRQADLLRSDTKRAARYEESAGRIREMQERRSEIIGALNDCKQNRQALQEAWHQQLAEARLPELSPEALREWQTGRDSALAISDRLAELKRDIAQQSDRQQHASSMLATALDRIGQRVAESTTLSACIDLAMLWEKRMTEADAERSAQAKAARLRHVERQRLSDQIANVETDLEQHLLAVRGWCEKLFLKPDSESAVVRARLDELDTLSRQSASLAELKLRLSQSQAVIQVFEQQASELASMLAEPEPVVASDIAARLLDRLHQSAEQAVQKTTLTRDKKRACDIKTEAQAEHALQAGMLADLCKAAGVGNVEALPQAEELAAQKRQAGQAVDTLRHQLMQASAHSEAELRERLAEQDVATIASERERCRMDISRLEQDQADARQAEETARRALEQIDTSDSAAAAREAMESAIARYRAAIRPWARLKLAHGLLQRALKQFRERAQAPMVKAASIYFALMTEGRYVRLVADESGDEPILMAEREDGVSIRVEAMSEGTADQLYLALRLASLEMRRSSGSAMPLILDDVLMTSDDQRAAHILKALAKFSEGGQVMVFTHHQHVLDITRSTLADSVVKTHHLSC